MTEGGIFEQFEAQGEVARILIEEMPEGAASIELRITEVAGVQNLVAVVHFGDGSSDSIPLSFDFDDYAVSRLRASMYQPGAGTWFSGTIHVDRSGSVDSNFDYDSEPDWGIAPVDPIVYVKDQEKYPRDAVNQPAWLKKRISEGLARRSSGRE